MLYTYCLRFRRTWDHHRFCWWCSGCIFIFCECFVDHCLIFSFSVYVSGSLFVLLPFGHCIVCLWFTVSDNPLGIFNLFMCHLNVKVMQSSMWTNKMWYATHNLKILLLAYSTLWFMHMHSQQLFLFGHVVFKLKLKCSLMILKYVIFYVSIIYCRNKKIPNVESITKTEMQLICANPKGINLQIVKYQMFRTIHINAFSSPT